MRILDVLATKGRQVHTVQPQQSVLDAIQKLNAHNIGALAVVDGAGQLVGILSERDILRIAGRQRLDLAQARVEEHMSRDVIITESETDIDDALAVMSEHRIRHLPVIRNGKLDGFVSQGDLVKARLDDSLFETRQLTCFVMGTYPA